MIILTRRLLVRGLGTLALANFTSNHGLPVRAAAEVTETVTISTPSGKRVSAILALPSNIPAPAVVIIHGALGRSSWFIDLAKHFAEQGFVGLAIDLFDGNVTTDFSQADMLVAGAQSHLDRTVQTIVGVARLASEQQPYDGQNWAVWPFVRCSHGHIRCSCCSSGCICAVRRHRPRNV